MRFMIGNIRLYHNYARLVVRSFGLQKAVDENGVDLPAAFVEVSISRSMHSATVNVGLAEGPSINQHPPR